MLCGQCLGGKSASKVDKQLASGARQIHEFRETLTKPVATVWIFIVWFVAIGFFGLLFPEAMLNIRGLSFQEDSCSNEGKMWIRGLEQAQVLQTGFMGALHLVVVGHGAPEARMISNNHMSAVRTLLLTNSLWIVISCISTWTLIIPEMQANGWHHDWLLIESMVFAGLGVMTLVESQSGKEAWFGGFVNIETRGAYIQMPRIEWHNSALLFWMGVSAFGGVVFIVAPNQMVGLVTGDFLAGRCLALGGVVLRITGLCLANQALCILTILSSRKIALAYAATRNLWAWSFAMGAFFVGSKQVHLLFTALPAWPHYFLVALFFAVCVLARMAMHDFRNTSIVERTTGTDRSQ